MTRTIGFVGAGNMAEAMMRGLLRGEDFAAAHVSASGPRLERVQELRDLLSARRRHRRRARRQARSLAAPPRPPEGLHHRRSDSTAVAYAKEHGTPSLYSGHYSPVGYKLVAEALAEALVPLAQKPLH